MKLDSWRIDQKLTFDGLAALLGVSLSTAWRLCRGTRVPNRAQMVRIRTATAGQVTWNDFAPDAPAPEAPSPGEGVPANA